MFSPDMPAEAGLLRTAEQGPRTQLDIPRPATF